MSLIFFRYKEKLIRYLYQNIQTGGFEQSDLVSDGERRKARQLFGELHRLDDALGGQLAELIPQVNVQGHAPF